MIGDWIKRLIQARAQPEKADQAPSVAPAVHGPKTAEADQKATYSSDEPVRSKSQDRYNRWPFAKRIAQTIATRADPSSIVIGLYGPWGDGKTSTLHMMAAALGSYPHVVVVQFNPWLFQSEEQLLRGFFNTLAEAIDRSLPTKAEKVGGLLKRYGSLLSIASIPVAPGVDLKPGEAAKGLGETLSSVSLEDLRQRVDKFLADSGRRVVILIDDIDRLDRIETHAILKLVKLSAGFKHTSYVLSFDDEMVAAAIGERYGQGDIEAGRGFLEKIIQVPLHLPPPDQLALRQTAFGAVEEALKTAGIELSQERIDAFVRHFVDGLEPRLRTPRQAKLYGNAIMFALPLLKGEADTVDLLLVEGIRIFYPKLYKSIRDNPEAFLARDVGAARHDDPNQKRAKALIEGALAELDEDARQEVRKGLLEAIFPRLSNMGYGSDWDPIWEKGQRIASKPYFDRYFTYSVKPGDVSDLEIGELLTSMSDERSPQPDELIRAFAARSAIPQLIRKLRIREESIGMAAARRLAIALAGNGPFMLRERGPFVMGGTRTQAAILVSQLIRLMPEGVDRQAVAEEVMRVADPLPFASECYRWLRKTDDQSEDRRILSPEGEASIAGILIGRIREHDAQEPLWCGFGNDADALYWVWATKGDQAEVRARLVSLFEQDRENVDRFLDIFVGEAWGLETGLSHRADLSRDTYEAIARLVDPGTVVVHLRARYGADLDTESLHQPRDTPTNLRFARQFARIHQHVLQEKTQGDGAD